MVRQYQIVLFPDKLRAYGITHNRVIDAVQKANRESGGSVLELGEAEYMVRATGYLKTLDDFRAIPLSASDGGVPVKLGRKGIEQILEIELTADEKAALAKSADAVREPMSVVKL